MLDSDWLLLEKFIRLLILIGWCEEGAQVQVAAVKTINEVDGDVTISSTYESLVWR